jgi:hypothetical protein
VVHGLDHCLQAASHSMTFSPLIHDDADFHVSKASKYLAKAITELRERGDYAYATILLHHMHNLHRPEYLPAPTTGPLLPQLPARLHN